MSELRQKQTLIYRPKADILELNTEASTGKAASGRARPGRRDKPWLRHVAREGLPGPVAG